MDGMDGLAGGVSFITGNEPVKAKFLPSFLVVSAANLATSGAREGGTGLLCAIILNAHALLWAMLAAYFFWLRVGGNQYFGQFKSNYGPF
jgi:hypothetical protein